MKLTAGKIAELCGGRIICGETGVICTDISTNSRKTADGELFVPVIGERTDAHRFIAQALKNGASVSLTSEHHSAGDLLEDRQFDEALPEGKTIIAVEHTVRALQRLGTACRQLCAGLPVISVTGPVGKTTTREMITDVLSTDLRVFQTAGNFNSQIGVPITAYRMDKDYDIAATELGMSDHGEMTVISSIMKPDLAVMTNIGISHIAQLGSQENILKEKLHILDGMGDCCTLYVNGDDPILSSLTEERIHAYGIAAKKRIRVVYFGTGDNASVRAEEICLEDGTPAFTVRVYDEEGYMTAETRLHLKVLGMHMIHNALAASACAVHFHVPLQHAAQGLSSFGALKGRGELLKRGGICLINDSYNAAPDSMRAGLTVLNDMNVTGRRIAVLADMKELGPDEVRLHREIGTFIAQHCPNINAIVLLGPLAEEIGRGISETEHRSIMVFSDKTRLLEAIPGILRSGDAVLLKGSNSMGLSELAELFMTADFENGERN